MIYGLDWNANGAHCIRTFTDGYNANKWLHERPEINSHRVLLTQAGVQSMLKEKYATWDQSTPIYF